MVKLLGFLIVLSCIANADSPGSNIITLKGATDGTKIGNNADALNVYLSNNPNGASTSALQTQIDNDLNSFATANHSDLLGVNTSLSSLISNTNRSTPISTFRNLYASTGVTTSAFLTLISSTSSKINRMNVFDSSGQTMVISYASSCGALSSGSNSYLIQPGGSGEIGFQIPIGSCVGIEAVSATAGTGELDVMFIQ